MNYLGIDVAKHTHVAVVLDASGSELIRPFPFENSREGFQLLSEKIAFLKKEEIIAGLESTAHYGKNLIQYLLGEGIALALINPLQTAAMRKAAIRKTKTDKVDATFVARTLMLGNLRFLQKDDLQTAHLRSLCGMRQDLVKSRSRLKIQLAACVDRCFPELNAFFRSGLHIKTSYELLKRYADPSEIQRLHLTRLANLLMKHSRGKYTKADAIRLRELANQSVGVPSPALTLQIRQIIAHIELLNMQLDEVESAIANIMHDLVSPIMTIPGLGTLNAAMILSVIGDISRFSSPAKLLAYAGLDPAVSQSGAFTARSTRMSKRGNSMLRYALVFGSHNVARNNKTFADYYQLKISQGKSHYCALGHVAAKLVRVIFLLLTSGIAFNLP